MELTIKGLGDPVRIPAGEGETLLRALTAAGYGQSVHTPCGGSGTCGRCKVTAAGPLRSAAGEEKLAAGEEVLACRWYPAGDVTLWLTRAEGEREGIAAHRRDIPGGGEGLGLAVDIGTTTVAAYLYDLASGRCLDTAGAMNAQRPYGSDVISRIRHCDRAGGLEELTAAIRGQIRELAQELCGELTRIRRVSIAGNTVMEHIFAGLSPVSIGVAPFTPVSLFGDTRPAAELLEGFAPEAELYLAPCVAGYVGGDITAGLMSSGACDCEGTVFFLDIGTNGEMGIGDRGGFLTCATAAGPAFEGAGIVCGTPARKGAIDHVEPDLTFTVLGGGEPLSLCGSGIIDGVAALLAQELVDETGRMEEGEYRFGEKVFLSQDDIRQIQLAKGAVRAGLETLLARTGKTYDDIDRVMIAGGFGSYLRTDSACAIGLLPPALGGKTCHVGNSAGMGAALALTPEGRDELARVAGLCGYVELSGSALFNEKYIDGMMFDEWEEVYGG